MFSLYHLLGGVDHVVAQIIKSELVIRAVGDVGEIGLAAFFRIGLMFVDAVYG